ncbi:MAG: OsmC family protein, partial [Actinomycetota bacterium]|nr:OsmC family protein [Actinomycetota bacterium]
LNVSARGLSLVVDRLPEQGGPGDGFRSTELLLGALGACMVGTMLTFAENQGIEVGTVNVHLEDEAATAPTRVARIKVTMELGGNLTDRELESLKRVAARCRIHSTLKHAPEIEFELKTR